MFIMSFSWLVDDSHLCHLLAVAPYQYTSHMVLCPLVCWSGTWRWTKYILHITNLLHCRSYINVSTGVKGYVAEIPVLLNNGIWLCFSRSTSPSCWNSCSHTLWAALERQGIWQDPSRVGKGLLSDCSSWSPVAAVCAPGKAMPSFSWPQFSCCCWLANSTQKNPVSLLVDHPWVLYVLQLLAERHQWLSCASHAAFTDRKLAFCSTGREAVHKTAAV